MHGVEGMDESRVSSDDCMDAQCLADFYGMVVWLMHCQGTGVLLK